MATRRGRTWYRATTRPFDDFKAHVSLTRLDLDERGWEEVADLFAGVLEEIISNARRVTHARSRASNDEEEVEVSVTRDVRKQVEARIKELEPLVAEHDRLRQVAELLDGKAAPSSGSRSRSTPRRTITGATTRRAKGQRSNDALKLIREKPGITVADTAEALGIGTTYLYRLLPRLEREGLIRKQGKGYVPA